MTGSQLQCDPICAKDKSWNCHQIDCPRINPLVTGCPLGNEWNECDGDCAFKPIEVTTRK